MQTPITPHGPGFGKVAAYRIPDDPVPIFKAATKNTITLKEN
ncbi:hypothetical protein [Streptomyces sp. SID1121]